MGVPKFFHFISNRYPCINKVIKAHEIPQYDNLYLDMNSIIHTCSHPADSDIHFRIGKKEFSDEDIYRNVSRYVEIIVSIVKPMEVLYLAFDGVSPRAKINQQRANRFRYKDVNKLITGEDLFDANCITPGTIFMAELIDHMKHFVAFKVSTDPFWQKCKIVLSGPEVPGEGEHKIMEYIRYNKAQKEYNHNTRHCLYSLDADLIMLGLCTHEPHFSLLRENVPFGKTKRMLTPEESDFHLFHLSLLREYLEYEFASVKSKLKFDFDLENIIDDWVLIGFLVGNDFIPQLPNLYIVNGALPFLYKLYIKVLPTLDGYINESGKLNLPRFEKFIKSLSCLTTSPCENYYNKKLKFNNVDESTIQTLVDQYIVAIQWTLIYYYEGCCSWSWYYPYHYAPLVGDIKQLKDFDFTFDMSKPFLPLQHLLAVLPPANAHLLPKALQFLLTNPKSPIIEYYPETFETDLNGKTNDWEALVLIPFIDDKKLIKAMEPYNAKLSVKERKRNINGSACVYTYTKTSLGQYPVDTVFDSFVNHAKLDYINPKSMQVPKNKLIKSLCQNVSFGLRFPGFPTFKYVPHTVEFKTTEIMTTPTRSNTVEVAILNVLPKPALNLEEVAKELLGQSIYINWPHLQQAHVIGVTNIKEKIILQNFWKSYSDDNLKKIKLSTNDVSNIVSKKKCLAERYKKYLGVDIGETDILVYVFPAMGKRYVCGSQGQILSHTKWSALSELVPYQLVVKEVKMHKVSFELFKTTNDLFAESFSCFVTDHPHYGSMGVIKSLQLRQQQATVTLKVTTEPDFTLSNENFFTPENDNDYISCGCIAKKLNVNPTLISRITGSILVVHESMESDASNHYNIGLRIKIPKHDKELYGYTKKKNDLWYYSNKAVRLIEEYMDKFPELFVIINENIKSSTFKIADLFPEGMEKLNLVKCWLVEKESSYTAFLECGTKTLGTEGVPKLEKFISDFLQDQDEPKELDIKISFQGLFKPGSIVGLVPPDVKVQNKLLDRIVCVKENFTVPLGLKGTIIGIQEKEDKWKTTFEVLFDACFTGGLTLYGSSEHKCYRLTIADFINISHGQRDASARPKEEKERRSVAKASKQPAKYDTKRSMASKKTESVRNGTKKPAVSETRKPINRSSNASNNNTNAELDVTSLLETVLHRFDTEENKTSASAVENPVPANIQNKKAPPKNASASRGRGNTQPKHFFNRNKNQYKPQKSDSSNNQKTSFKREPQT